MRDEDFAFFIKTFGEATHRVSVPEDKIDQWRGRLPDQLLHYWQHEGQCAYADGLFWTVDPDEYEDVVDDWLEGSPFEEMDSFHVIARSAFGDLYACGEKRGPKLKLSCSTNNLIALAKSLRPKNVDRLNFEIRTFFSVRSKSKCDFDDESGKPLFERALAKLGHLAHDEMYGFEPALIAGGRVRLQNLARVKTGQHLTILRQLAAPTVPYWNVDFDKLMKP